MDTKKLYDYLVLGSGPAGHVSAIKAARLGLKVAVVEKDRGMFGGVCLNEGCIPAKSLYNSAGMIETVRKNQKLCGLDDRPVEIDMPGIVSKSREAAQQLHKGLSFLFEKNAIEVIYGNGSFVDKGTVSITGDSGDETLARADRFLIATGSAPAPLPGIPFDGNTVISSSGAIRLEKIPENILIIGGGAIGVEFAGFYGLLGSEVVLAEAESTILPSEDRETARCLQSILKHKGIKVLTGSRVKGMAPDKGGAKIVIERRGMEEADVYEKVLVAVGRVPATFDIGLDKAGVDTDEKGYIRVDADMRTNAGHIYAAGDVINSPMLAHVAYAEGEAAAEAAAGKKPEPVDYGSIPNAVYSDIKAASVGMNEEQLRSGNIEYRAGKQFFRANGRAVANSETEGFIKVLAHPGTHRLLGAHIVGHGADELIHEFALAKRAGLTVEAIAGTVHAHPTFSETAAETCRSVFGKPIHG